MHLFSSVHPEHLAVTANPIVAVGGTEFDTFIFRKRALSAMAVEYFEILPASSPTHVGISALHT